jgi:DNA-binding XRE family transcriptional regulator
MGQDGANLQRGQFGAEVCRSRLRNLPAKKAEAPLLNRCAVRGKPYPERAMLQVRNWLSACEGVITSDGVGMNKDESPESLEFIAARLEWVRRYYGLSQKEFAESIGVQPTTYSNWRRCTQNLSLDGAKRIKNRYRVSLDFLFTGDANNLPDQIRSAWEARPDA